MRVSPVLTLSFVALILLAACQDIRWPTNSQSSTAIERSLDSLPKEVRVGLLLPLSGPYESLGKDMLRAAQMALFEIGPNSFVLLPKDTAGTEQGAALAAQELLDDGAELLIGPVLSHAVKVVTPIAQAADVRVLAFSTVAAAADDGTYLLGNRPEEQVDRVVQYALDQGIERFAGLAPDDAYGDTAMRALQRAVVERGGIMKDIQFYPSTSDDPSPVVRDIANFSERQAALKAERRILEAMGEDDEVAQAVLKQIDSLDTFGGPPFDAIMIADGGDRLQSIAALLTFYDVDPKRVQFLGTMRWQEEAHTPSEDALIGGWLAASDPDALSAFESRFNSVFGQAPKQPRLAGLAYDATAMAVTVQRDLGDRRFGTQSLTDTEGFVGAMGLFRLQPDGLAQHGLAIVEVESGGSVREIDPAPSRFDDRLAWDPLLRSVNP